MKSVTDGLISFLLSILITSVQFGCSATSNNVTPAIPSTQYENRIHRLNVAIVPSEKIPVINCVTFDKGRARAAAKEAGELAGKGAAAGALAPIYGIIEDPRAVFFIPLWPILIPALAMGGAVVGGTAGAISGAIEGDYQEFPMKQAEEIKGVAEYAYSVNDINRVLAEDLVKVGRELTDYKYTVSNVNNLDKDNDIILKAGITYLEFRGEDEKDPDTRLKVQVDVIVEDANGINSFSDTFEYVSAEHELSDWIENNGELLVKEYKICFQNINEKIIKEIFFSNKIQIEVLLTPEPQTILLEAEKEQLQDVLASYANVDMSAGNVKTSETKTNIHPLSLELEKQYLAYVPESDKSTVIRLRKEPDNRFSNTEIKLTFLKHDFYESQLNPGGTFHNDFEDNQDGTITDHATGLVWQKSGSSKTLNIRSARSYIKNLNRNDFAGYADWRMPTVEELASLLQKSKINDVHMDPLFGNQQYRCWSVDRAGPMHGPAGATITRWVIDYHHGKARKSNWYDSSRTGWPESHILFPDNYVRAVRSVNQ